MISSDVKAIVSTLRDLRLGWIADEIEEVIRSGKISSNDYVEPNSRSQRQPLETALYDEQEEQAICLRTLEAYFVYLGELWDETNRLFSKVTGTDADGKTVTFKIVDEEGEPIEPFQPDYMVHKKRIKDVLSRAIGLLHTENDRRQ